MSTVSLKNLEGLANKMMENGIKYKQTTTDEDIRYDKSLYTSDTVSDKLYEYIKNVKISNNTTDGICDQIEVPVLFDPHLKKYRIIGIYKTYNKEKLLCTIGVRIKNGQLKNIYKKLTEVNCGQQLVVVIRNKDNVNTSFYKIEEFVKDDITNDNYVYMAKCKLCKSDTTTMVKYVQSIHGRILEGVDFEFKYKK